MPAESFAQRAFYAFGHALFGFVYRVRVLGALPQGSCLIVPNHITWVDALILQLATPRRIRFIIDEEYYQHRLLQPFLKLVGVIPISRARPREAVRRAAAFITAGEAVCIFPEGQLSRTGTLHRLQRGFEMIAHHARSPVVPVYLDQLWGSIFSFRGGRFFRKWPRQFPYHATVAFGQPLSYNDARQDVIHEALLKLGADCFEQRPVLRDHLARRVLRGLKRKPFTNAVTDGMDHSSLSRGKLLGVSLALARHLARKYPEKRIGIVLPAGKGAIVANLSVLLAGKIPVDLNFTASAEAIQCAIEIAELETVVTATPFKSRFPDFPWPKNIVLLDKVLPPLKAKILLAWLKALTWPAAAIARQLRLPKEGGPEEAVLLFTSGSSGEPKGVVLSHRNLIGNVTQFSVILDAGPQDVILASLPFFHSFGSTVTLWYPLIEGVRTVTYPNPLEAATNAALIERYQITVLLATATFLRGYLRKAEPQQLRSTRLVVVGAEKMPLDLSEKFHARFGRHVYEGYGLTETSPVVSVNLPDIVPERADLIAQPLYRLGSVGKMAPGIAAEIRHPETDEKLSLYDSGMLWLRGPNIFEGYLKDPVKTAGVLRRGWLKTGDIGRFDLDGFLYIEGRLSRFSKIGGEMVPHELIEQKVIEVAELDGTERQVAIMSVSDPAKGEALVLLTSVPLDLQDLRQRLANIGFPNLWIPRQAVQLEKIPVLASGKLDLRTCQEIARTGAAAAEEPAATA